MNRYSFNSRFGGENFVYYSEQIREMKLLKNGARNLEYVLSNRNSNRNQMMTAIEQIVFVFESITKGEVMNGLRWRNELQLLNLRFANEIFRSEFQN